MPHTDVLLLPYLADTTTSPCHLLATNLSPLARSGTSPGAQQGDKNEYADRNGLEQHERISSLSSSSHRPRPHGFAEKTVIYDENAIVAEGGATIASASPSSVPSLESDSCVPGRATISSKASPSIFVTVFMDDEDDQISTYSAVNNAEDSTGSSRVAFDNDPGRAQGRPYSAAGSSMPMIYRPLSRSSSSFPSRPSSILLAPQSNRLSRSMSSCTSMNANGGTRPTIRLLTPSSTSPADRPISMSISKSSSSSLRTLTEANVPSTDYLRVPTVDRRRRSNSSLSSKETHKSSLPQAPPTSWQTPNSHLVTPPFSRSGLDAPEVVLPLTVREFQQQQKAKEQEKRAEHGVHTFIERRHSTTQHARRQGAGSLLRALSVISGRRESYVSPPDTSTPLQQRGGPNNLDRPTTLKTKVEGLNSLSRTSTDNATGARGNAAGGPDGCRKYFTAIFVRGGSREKPEPSKMLKGIPNLKEQRRTIAKVFSKIIGKQDSEANVSCSDPVLFSR